MKVVNFLEWYKSTTEQSRANILNTGGSIDAIANFYSQPFKPEMITELLEGWKENENEREYDACSETLVGRFYEKINAPYDADIAFPMLDVSMDLTIMVNCGEDWDGLKNSFIYPKTLNDFISDCQRAGIELTFKKEIEDKLC